MTTEMALALIGFAFAMSISPGPGNFLLLASGANFGFARSVPLIFGISGGFLTIVLFVGMGLGHVLSNVPELYTALRIACGVYILWMAFKIARSGSLGTPDDKMVVAPFTFFQAALLQFVNPKAWAVALVVTVSYTVPERFAASFLAMTFIFAAVNIPSISVWALSGAALHRHLSQGLRIHAFNIVMAALLVGSMTPVLLGTTVGG